MCVVVGGSNVSISSGMYSSSEFDDSILSFVGGAERCFLRFGVGSGVVGSVFSSLRSPSGLVTRFFFFVHFKAAYKVSNTVQRSSST